jgi:hypothetical protein
VTAVPAKHLRWNRLARSLRPTYGARANAADSLFDLQQTRRVRAEAADALAHPVPTLPAEHPVTNRPTR